MEGTYAIEQGGQKIGQAQVTKQGLYYHFTCHCQLSGEVICRLTAVCGDKTENLGVPVPEKGEFVLRKKVAVSHLGEGPLHIRAIPKHAELTERFIPLCPEEPFRYLTRLKNAYLERRGTQLGIVIKE